MANIHHGVALAASYFNDTLALERSFQYQLRFNLCALYV